MYLRYREIVRICALEYDFSLFENGDQTIVTDRGMNLSGGQQARINLARAIYRDSDIYLLDDSLTALDPQVQDYIFDEGILKFLANKVVVLVTQTAHQLEKADYVIILANGTIKSSGKPSQEFLQEVENITASENQDIIEESETEKISATIEEKLDEESLLRQEEITEHKSVYGEIKKQGKVDYSTYKKYFAFGGGMMLMLLNGIVFGLGQGADSYSDMLLSNW